MPLLIATKRKDFRKRIDILKDIHRRKILEKMAESEANETSQIRENLKPPTKECVACGKDFLPEFVFSKTKYCSTCKPNRDEKIYIRRAKEWEPLLKKKFKDNNFFKEDVYAFFNHKYSLGVIQKVLLAMARHGDLTIIRGDHFCHFNRYTFQKTS